MWGWVKGLVLALLEFFFKRAEQPDTIEDAKNTKDTKSEWNDIVDRVRKPPSDGD